MKRLKIAVLMAGPRPNASVIAVRDSRGQCIGGDGRERAADRHQGTKFTMPADVDVAFIALHGHSRRWHAPADARKRSIAYTGSGPQASARAFDKVLAKQEFLAAGIPTPKYEVFDRSHMDLRRLAKLGFRWW